MTVEQKETLKQIYKSIEEDLNALRHLRDEMVYPDRIPLAKVVVNMGIVEEALEQVLFR